MGHIERYIEMGSICDNFTETPRIIPSPSEEFDPAGTFETFFTNFMGDPKKKRNLSTVLKSIPGSRPKKTVAFLAEYVADRAVKNFFVAIEAVDFDSALIWADLAYGMNFTYTTVMAAELAIAGGINDAIDRAIDRLNSQNIEVDAVNGADTLLNMREIGNQGALRLISDPTGKSTVNWSVDNLKAELAKPPNQRVRYVPKVLQPDYVIKGAEIGARLYDLAYGLSE